MWAEFEEKEFECAFNRQLGIIGPNFWCPGQVLEATVGFDGAALTEEWLIWRHFRPWIHRPGLFFDPIGMQILFGDNADRLPPFRFNLFVQHKRPEHRDKEGRLKKEWAVWNSPYFRYKIDDEQQKILAKLEQHTGQSALVIYSCASFHTKQALWAHIQNGTIIENSNFVEPSKLTGHHIYTFNAPGSHGNAFSEREEIHGKGFRELIAERRHASGEAKRASKLVISAGQTIKKIFNEMDAHSEQYGHLELARNVVVSLVIPYP